MEINIANSSDDTYNFFVRSRMHECMHAINRIIIPRRL